MAFKLEDLSKYNKLWVALAGALVQGLGLYFGVDSVPYVITVSLLTAVGVYGVTNAK